MSESALGLNGSGNAEKPNGSLPANDGGTREAKRIAYRLPASAEGGMMPIETLDDVIEWIADQMAVFGAHEDDNDAACCADDPCRSHFASDLKQRILNAVEIEHKLYPRQPPTSDTSQGEKK